MHVFPFPFWHLGQNVEFDLYRFLITAFFFIYFEVKHLVRSDGQWAFTYPDLVPYVILSDLLRFRFSPDQILGTG